MAGHASDPEGSRRISEAGPPVGEIAFRVINPLMKLLLRSPLHFLAGDSLMLITFTGRRTGTEYSTPVGYHGHGEALLVFTHSGWWRNLRGGEPVTLRLRGERRRGIARPTTDREAVARHVERFLDENGVEAARRIGLRVEGDEPPSLDEIERGLEETVVIEIELE